MPSFESLILASPIGFIGGCNSINSISSDDDTIMKLINTAIIKVYNNDINSTSTDNTTVLSTLMHIINSYKSASVPPTNQEFASILDSSTTLSRDIIATIITHLEKYIKEETISIFKAPNGTLFDFKWRVGVALCSNKCKDLQSPYIAISFKVRNTNNDVDSYTAELTYREFCEFQSTFREVAQIMDNM